MEYGFEGGFFFTVYSFSTGSWEFTAYHFASMEGEEFE
jgi:hypothetical protein